MDGSKRNSQGQTLAGKDYWGDGKDIKINGAIKNLTWNFGRKEEACDSK